jgi:sigma-E factor negative regulatory protein RseB
VLARLYRSVFVVATATLLPWAAAQAGSAAAPSAPAGTSADARAWLLRVHEAASQRNYQGTLVVSAGGTVSSSRIAHYCEGPQRYERIEALDGQPRLVFRHNDLVQTLWPAQRMAVIEQRDPLTTFPALLRGSEGPLFDHYDLHAEGEDRVAGHGAKVYLLAPRDAHRFAQRLWADTETGLLLRSDILGAEGRVLESAAFTEVAIGVRALPETVLQPMKQLDGYRVLRPTLARTQLEAEGWTLKSPVPGFHEINCVRRGQPGAPAGRAELLQVIFSDGLTHVSVFIEPFQAARHKPVRASIGATHTMMRQQGEWWVTVMGDVPMATLKRFSAALQRRP